MSNVCGFRNVMADGSDELITWFERAVNINYLYYPAYGKLSYANYPRWGGSADILIPFFNYLVENTPKGGRAYMKLIRWYEMDFRNQLEDEKSPESKMAYKLVRRFIKEFPKSEYGWQQLARLAQSKGRYKNALGYLDKALKLDQPAYLWQQKGYCLKMMGRYGDSFEAYLKATELNPHNDVSWSALGYNYLHKKNDQLAAIECFNKALIYKPQDEYAQRNRALAYCFSGELDTALDLYNKLLASGYGHEWTYFGRGLTYWCMGKYQSAEKDFKKSISISSRMRKTMVSYKNKLKKVKGGKPRSYKEYLAKLHEKKKAEKEAAIKQAETPQNDLPTSEKQLAKWVVGTEWATRQGDLDSGATGVMGIRRFYPDGVMRFQFRNSKWIKQADTKIAQYTISDDDTIQLTGSNQFTLKFHKNFKSFEGKSKDGKITVKGELMGRFNIKE